MNFYSHFNKMIFSFMVLSSCFVSGLSKGEEYFHNGRLFYLAHHNGGSKKTRHLIFAGLKFLEGYHFFFSKNNAFVCLGEKNYELMEKFFTSIKFLKKDHNSEKFINFIKKSTLIEGNIHREYFKIQSHHGTSYKESFFIANHGAHEFYGNLLGDFKKNWKHIEDILSCSSEVLQIKNHNNNILKNNFCNKEFYHYIPHYFEDHIVNKNYNECVHYFDTLQPKPKEKNFKKSRDFSGAPKRTLSEEPKDSYFISYQGGNLQRPYVVKYNFSPEPENRDFLESERPLYENHGGKLKLIASERRRGTILNLNKLLHIKRQFNFKRTIINDFKKEIFPPKENIGFFPYRPTKHNHVSPTIRRGLLKLFSENSSFENDQMDGSFKKPIMKKTQLLSNDRIREIEVYKKTTNFSPSIKKETLEKIISKASETLSPKNIQNNLKNLEKKTIAFNRIKYKKKVTFVIDSNGAEKKEKRINPSMEMGHEPKNYIQDEYIFVSSRGQRLHGENEFSFSHHGRL